MEILFRQNGINSWEIFRSDRPYKIGDILKNTSGPCFNFTAHEYPRGTAGFHFTQMGGSINEVQERVLDNFPKLCAIEDRLHPLYNFEGKPMHGCIP